MHVDRHGLEILDRAACLTLLADEKIGRVGFSSSALPVILPVDYVVMGNSIVFRTARGSMLDNAVRKDTVVAFEVDNVGRHNGNAWSVVVTGQARELLDPSALAAADEALGGRWIGEGRYVQVSTELISGRRR